MGHPGAVTVTWYQHAMAYAEMKWPHLAPHSRAGLADVLATVTPLLTRETGRRPPPRRLRAACPGRAVHAAGRLARDGVHDHPQAGGVSWRPRLLAANLSEVGA
jgi:hypothetical protein